MSRKVELEPEKVLQAIYIAATDAIEAHGIESITIRDICQRAKISTGSFYHFYPNKQKLLNRMIDYMENYYRDEVVPYLHGSALEKMEQLIVAYVKRITRRGVGYTRKNITFVSDGGLSAEEFEGQYRYTAFISTLTEGQELAQIRTDVPATTLASLIFSFMQGEVLHWCQLDGEYDIFDKLKTDLPVFLDCIKAS
ncbi:MAG: TetR/AcrR family transcriptional regulator [Oscillospiraceae bacterium]